MRTAEGSHDRGDQGVTAGAGAAADDACPTIGGSEGVLAAAMARSAPITMIATPILGRMEGTS